MQMKAALIGMMTLAGTACADPCWAQSTTPGTQNGAIMWEEPQRSGATSADQMKSMAFTRIILQIPDGQVLGYAHDVYCGNGKGYQAITLDRGFRDLPIGAYQQSFGAALTRAGYKTVEKSLLFGDATPQQPDLQVGAAITAIEMKACQKFSLGMLAPNTRTTYEHDIHGRLIERRERVNNRGTPNFITTISETIEWQVYDPLNKRVIFKASTQGSGKATGIYEDSQLQAMYGAFDAAAQALIVMPEFRNVAAVSTGEQTAAAQLADIPAEIRQIPGLPLSTAPFQQRAKEIQSHVATVRRSGGHGSGFYIADGLLLTNHHVAAKGSAVKVRFLSGKEISGFVVASDAARDVALIRTEKGDLPGLPIQHALPDVGSQVYVVGSPLKEQLEGTVSSGIVSSIRTLERDKKLYIQSDAAIQGGNSGGPMFDNKGNIIGISVSGIGENNIGLNFFIPIAEALQSVGVVIEPPEPAKATKVSAEKKATP